MFNHIYSSITIIQVYKVYFKKVLHIKAHNLQITIKNQLFIKYFIYNKNKIYYMTMSNTNYYFYITIINI